jgi:hypothetical protein
VNLVGTDDGNKRSLQENEATEEKFFEQFAALEDSLALLQLHMRDLSENVKLFGGLAMYIRRSVCPVALAQDPTRSTATCVSRDPQSACGS